MAGGKIGYGLQVAGFSGRWSVVGGRWSVVGESLRELNFE